MNENKRVKQDDIIYLINDKEKIASIIDCISGINEITIPRSIIYESKEYIINCILKNAFSKFSNSTITSIQFTNDSELQKIDENAFFNSSIERIIIPSQVTELKDGWCNCTAHLTKIRISSSNPRYSCLDEKMIIGKSRIESNIYDNLVFCVRNIDTVVIPDFIEHICPYAFFGCGQLKHVSFLKNSKLRIIDDYAFNGTLIGAVRIPSQVTRIGKRAFSSHIILRHVFFTEDSQLQIIDKEAFYNSQIQSITIPSQVTFIGEGAFYICQLLQQIEFPTDSKLQTIEKDTFYDSRIESLTIPSQVTELKEGWCNWTFELNKINVSSLNPRYSCIDEKMIIGKSSLDSLSNDYLVFCVRNIEIVKIPNYIKHICSYAFNGCKKIRQIDISNDSNLQTIGNNAFSLSSIRSINIPSQVTHIGKNAFCSCYHLQIFEIDDISKLELFEMTWFECSKNVILMISNLHSLLN